MKKTRKFFTSQTRPRSETSRSNELTSYFVSSPALNSSSSFTSSLASSVLTSSLITSTDKPGLRILLKQKKKKPKVEERFEICSNDSVSPKIKFKVCRSVSETSKNHPSLTLPVTGFFKTPESKVIYSTTQSKISQQLSVATAKSPLSAPAATKLGQSTTSSMLLTSVLASSGPPDKQGRNILSPCLSRKRPHVESTLPSLAVTGRPPTSCIVARTTDSTSSASAVSAVDVGASIDLSASKRSCDERYKEFTPENMEEKRRLLLEGKVTTVEDILGVDALKKFKVNKPKVDYNSNRISAKNLNISRGYMEKLP